MANNPYVNKVIYGNTVLVDISDTTAIASDVVQGKYFYTADGVRTVGTASGGSPSATQHTIYFEFTDSTNTTINAWYDDSFISDAIKATQPTDYGQKTIDSAELDGIEWYVRPTITWETVYDGMTDFYPSGESEGYLVFPYCWLVSMGDIELPSNSVWRVTFDGISYVFTPTSYINMWGQTFTIIGNPLFIEGDASKDDGSGVPIGGYAMNQYGAWTFAIDKPNTSASYPLKVERQVVL